MILENDSLMAMVLLSDLPAVEDILHTVSDVSEVSACRSPYRSTIRIFQSLLHWKVFCSLVILRPIDIIVFLAIT